MNLIRQINNLDIKARYGIFAACVLLAAGLDYALFLRLQINDLEKINEEIKTLSADTARVKGDIQRINGIKKGLEGMRARLRELNDKIRSVDEVPSIFEEIAGTANASGFKIDQLDPSKEGRQPLMTTPDAKYYVLPIVISAHCGYHVFGRFLNKLEQGSLLFLVQDLRMEGNVIANMSSPDYRSNRDSGKDAGVLAVQATLKVVLADRTPETKP
ncbi:MAG: type 4a pilus biogenesis protein PilO [Candidatus Omnitrophica bacterium]|nr:type 4a pilus biogenesis protein PilO [Candidatus Omnitrophota bacterium]